LFVLKVAVGIAEDRSRAEPPPYPGMMASTLVSI
jgi:hypothetical protein